MSYPSTGCAPTCAIDVTLTPSITPQTVANFMTYVNSGAYANTIIHRSLNAVNSSSTPPYLIQGGGYVLGPGNIPTLYEPLNPPVVNEFSASNVAGTLGMALPAGTNLNSATNEWYFNVTDNASYFDSGSYTVFGNVANDPSMAVLNAVNGVTTYSADFGPNAEFTDLPLIDYSCPNPVCPLVKPDNFVFVNSIVQIPAPAVTAAGVTDAATFVNSSKTGLSPGEFITLFGANFSNSSASYLGPTELATLQLQRRQRDDDPRRNTGDV